MLSLPAHGSILVGTWVCMIYKESYSLSLLLGICEERRNMFLSYVGTHVPDGLHSVKTEIPQNVFHTFENFNLMYQK